MSGDARYAPWVERWILPFVRDSTLWPVLLVLMGHAAAFLVPALLLAARDRELFAAAALLGLVLGSLSILRYELRCRGRPAVLSGLLVSTWLLAGTLAFLADRYGVF